MPNKHKPGYYQEYNAIKRDKKEQSDYNRLYYQEKTKLKRQANKLTKNV